MTPRNDCLAFKTNNRSELHFNQTRVANYDFTNPFDLTKAEIEGRKQAENFIRFLRSDVMGFGHSSVVGLGTQIGIRETRRIVGEYMVTEQDLLDCTLFPDRIALGNYSIDIHDPKGTAKTDIRRIPMGKWYSIPYRALVPKDLDNVLVAGRPISTTHVAHSAIRIMPICATLGHAAGVAAGLRSFEATPVPFRLLDPSKIQAELRKQNAILE